MPAHSTAEDEEARPERAADVRRWIDAPAEEIAPVVAVRAGGRHGRLVAMKAVAAGVLLVSTVALVLSQGAKSAPLSALEQRLQLVYGAAPAAVTPMVPAPYTGTSAELMASPTLYRAASAVANARAAIGTASLRRAYPNIPGIRAAAMMPSYGVAPAAPFAGPPPALAAYHVSIPTSASSPYYTQYRAIPVAPGAPRLASPMQAPSFTGYGVPTGMVGGYGGFRVAQPVQARTVQDMAVSAAINAGASAAAIAGSPQYTTGGGYASAMTVAAPTVTVPTSPSTVTAPPVATVASVTGPSMVQASVSAGPGVVQASVPGTETMKIVAGPGKGKIVKVNAAGKIVSSVGAVPAAGLPALPSMGSISVETPYRRLSGKEQADASAVSAGTGAMTAQDAASLTLQAQPDPAQTGGLDDDAKSADQEEASAVAGAEKTPAADAGEGDVAQVAVSSRGGVRLAPKEKGSQRRLPQLSLPTPRGYDESRRSRAFGHARGGDDGEGVPVPEQQLLQPSRAADAASRARISPDLTKLRDEAYGERPEALVRVPAGKRPGDFFSADVAGRGSMLVEVPEGVRGGDELQLLQVATTDGEELKWVRYEPAGSTMRRARGHGQPASRRDGDGPNQGEIDRQAAARDTVASAWRLGSRAPRSYFH